MGVEDALLLPFVLGLRLSETIHIGKTINVGLLELYLSTAVAVALIPTWGWVL